jgi:hypothetical protein
LIIIIRIRTIIKGYILMIVSCFMSSEPYLAEDAVMEVVEIDGQQISVTAGGQAASPLPGNSSSRKPLAMTNFSGVSPWAVT